jgi:hypothetical protein
MGAGIGVFYYQDAIQYRDKCGNIFGEIGQIFSSEIHSTCDQKSNLASISMAMIVGGIIFFIIGILFVGLKHKKVIRDVTNEQQQFVPSQINTDKIFCRYCGKERLILAEYCSFCGKSSRSLSTNTKKCISCSFITSEDSKFCANCGKEFHQSISNKSDIKTVHFKNSIDTRDDKTASSSGKNIRESRKHKPVSILAIITGVALAIVIIFAALYYPTTRTTTTTSPSIEASNSSAENKPDPGTAVTPDFLSYENPIYGVKMQYPYDWKVNLADARGQVANFFSPNSEAVQIGIEGLNYSGFPLNDYLTRAIDGYKLHPQTFPDFQLISSDTNGILAGRPGYTLVGTFYDFNAIEGRRNIYEIGTVIDNKAYHIRYFADKTKYFEWLPTAQHMINSLEISKP